MGKIIGKIFKLILIVLIFAILGALGFWLVQFKGWPWWFAAALIAGILGLWLGVIFVKKYLLRSRERQFVQRVIDQDTAAIERAPVSERHELLELQDHWKESVKRLQQSHLRKKGNPLYVLPWFLIMGESRTGKTSAVKNAQQSTPMSEISRSSGLTGTRNCDWWFFDQAVILDTAGRYTIPIDEGPDLEEWKQFLILLSKYRKREPLNGVIATISADKLLAADETHLREEGQSIRQRIDQMMRTVGAKFPVYVLITKMDLIHGFTEFNEQLPEGSVAQAMGYKNTAFRIYWRDVMEEAVKSILKSLKNLRFLLVHHNPEPSPGAIMFPNEFERMIPGMQAFLDAVFEENPYQETPLFRGLFFSSALRKGSPASDFLSITDMRSEAPAEEDSEEGFFLKDFFAGILPKDRDLFTPLREFVVWRRLTQSIGLFSWVLVSLALCGLLGFSFYHNYATIKGFMSVFYDPPRLEKDRTTNLLMLEKMRLEILTMERANKDWFLPRFGLHQSIHIADRLKKDFVKLFREGFLSPLENKLVSDIERVNKHVSEDDFVDYVGYVVAQIGVLSAYVSGKKLPLDREFRLIATDLLVTEDRRMLPEIADKFGSIYYAYLAWNKDATDAERRLEEFRRALIDLIDKRGRDLKWLVRKWIPDAPDIHLDDFWEGADLGDIKEQVVIKGAFTRMGRKHIESFISYIESALGIQESKIEKATASLKARFPKKVETGKSDTALKRGQLQALFEKRKEDFWTWYHQEFFREWYLFIERFREAEKHIYNVSAWQRLATVMTTDENPYFRMLQLAADEIEALHYHRQSPKWANMLIELNEVTALAKAQEEKKQSLTARLTDKEENIKKEIEQKVDKKAARALEAKIKQAGAWKDYVTSLQKIQLGVSSRKQCFDIYAAAFSYASGSGSSGAAGQQAGGQSQSLLAEAYTNYYKLKTMMTARSSYPVIWDLVFGPQDFLMTYAAEQAACFLQEQWQEQVLSYLQGIDPQKIPNLLFGKSEGIVWKFLDGTAKPFIGRNLTGYFARRDFRKNALPISGEFIHFLNQGTTGVIEYQPEYTVAFETLPLDVNDDAKVEPYASSLQVSCSDKQFVLENYNYPKTAAIKWSPDKCGDVSLTITFSDLKLLKSYKGKLGFAEFLKDYRDGTHTYKSEDFPEQKDHLKQLGVSWIKLSYRITGNDGIIQLLNRAPTKVPDHIVMCDIKEE